MAKWGEFAHAYIDVEYLDVKKQIASDLHPFWVDFVTLSWVLTVYGRQHEELRLRPRESASDDMSRSTKYKRRIAHCNCERVGVTTIFNWCAMAFEKTPQDTKHSLGSSNDCSGSRHSQYNYSSEATLTVELLRVDNKELLMTL